MAEVCLYVAASLDGFLADADGGVGWLEAFEDEYPDGEPGENGYEAFFGTVDCLVMGANTYEQIVTEFAGDAEDRAPDADGGGDDGNGDDAAVAGWPYGDVPTYVTTHRDLPRASDAVEFFAGDVADLAADLDAEYDTVWLVGGAALAREFVRKNLVDEIRLSIVPVLLGEGIRLFAEDGPERSLHLVDETAFESGIVELRYAL
ncbi:dihydrofolate reductase family protein [Halorarum halobium]|uniref:dihydrofolate reductase family protein n=1 Tax=Halorarum halobium TaxID=3075121 RepID=UPI0028AC2038|nr:dihydrofolate reductase family protein [Halobaculum sp. XH14]